MATKKKPTGLKTMKLVVYSLSYITKGKIKKESPKKVCFEPRFSDLVWDGGLAVFDLSRPQGRRAAKAFEEAAYREIHATAADVVLGHTAEMLQGLKKLRGNERKMRILALEGRIVALHKQSLTPGKRTDAVHYLRRAKKPTKKRAARTRAKSAQPTPNQDPKA